jgi:hypothetical protein
MKRRKVALCEKAHSNVHQNSSVPSKLGEGLLGGTETWTTLTIIIKLYYVISQYRSRDSAVGIATGYGLDDQEVGVRVPVWSRIFSSPRRPDWLWGPPSFLSNGYWGALSLGVKRQGCETDHSPATSAEFKKTWIYTSTPPHAFTA